MREKVKIKFLKIKIKEKDLFLFDPKIDWPSSLYGSLFTANIGIASSSVSPSINQLKHYTCFSPCKIPIKFFRKTFYNRTIPEPVL